MIAEPMNPEPVVSALVASIGNTSIRIGRWVDGVVSGSRSVTATDREGLLSAAAGLVICSDGAPVGAVVIGAVASTTLSWARQALATILDLEPLVVGEKVPLPMEVGVRNPQSVGTDRVCAAAAAYDRLRAACTVIDFGTAITVDVVDDDGVFLGGAILPGFSMQAAALHGGTDGLPLVDVTLPDCDMGRDTEEAICLGIGHGTIGAVRALVERYATALGKWPQVIATGGDLALVGDGDGVIDSRVPDLGLTGIGLAHARRLAEGAV